MTSRLATNPLVAGATAALFAGLSHVRRPRAFHPYGVGFRATLTPAAGADTGAVLFDRAEPWSAVVRLSRSLGLPEALHDPCGLAFRVPDAYGDGHHQDFLLISSGEAPVARHLILPSGGFAARPYSSLLPYRIDERTELVGARPLGGAPGPSLAELRDRGADGLEFAVRLATPSGEWRDVARLALGERLPTEESERLRFNPAHSGGGLDPVSFLNDLRPAAYRGSQEARRRHDGGAGRADTGSPSVSDAKEAPDMPADINEQLIKHLTDVHSIEEQALTQMRQAPQIAGDPELATVFERHLVETERQERLVRERLEAHGAKPSTTKDLAGKAGGIGMLLFARFNPDTPGKLVNHAFSYEHMEVAAYELLARVAERAGDHETVGVANAIAAEEREMAERLATNFDRAVAASLREQDPDDLGEQLNSYLADAHAIEKQSISLLEGGRKIVGEGAAAAFFDEHLDETRRQEDAVRERLEARGSSPSKIKDIGMRLGGFNIGAFFGVQPDTPAKLVGFAFAFEHLEIAGYEQLSRVAERAGDAATVELAKRLAGEEREAASRIEGLFDAAVDAALADQGVTR